MAAENDREFIFGPDDSVDGELAQADTQHGRGVKNLHHGVRSTALHLAQGNPRGGALLVAGGVLLAAGIAGFLSGRDTLVLVATSSVLLGAAALAYGVRVVRRYTARAAGELVEEREERRRIGFELDMAIAASLSREVSTVIPGCRYIEIAGAAHAGPLERPDEVNAAILQFFREA